MWSKLTQRERWMIAMAVIFVILAAVLPMNNKIYAFIPLVALGFFAMPARGQDGRSGNPRPVRVALKTLGVVLAAVGIFFLFVVGVLILVGLSWK